MQLRPCLFVAAFVVIGCSTVESRDPFAGTYRFVDPNERGYLRISALSGGR